MVTSNPDHDPCPNPSLLGPNTNTDSHTNPNSTSPKSETIRVW